MRIKKAKDCACRKDYMCGACIKENRPTHTPTHDVLEKRIYITDQDYVRHINDLRDEVEGLRADAVNSHEEMLKALKFALEWGESEIHNEYDGTSMLQERLEELNPIREAIVKAEGK